MYRKVGKNRYILIIFFTGSFYYCNQPASQLKTILYICYMSIIPALEGDIPALVALLNSGYRGEASKKGWTTEADLLQGEVRSSEDLVNTFMKNPGAVFLKYLDDQNNLQGCVYLEKKERKLYLGMLCVSPLIQAKGIGRQLMTAAENYARDKKCSVVFMKVISARHELIAWYERQHYTHTGLTEPFPADDRFGIPTRPLEFIIMEKEI
jgi:ribosomal protein S18 acetylase RimI-like enzyme